MGAEPESLRLPRGFQGGIVKALHLPSNAAAVDKLCRYARGEALTREGQQFAVVGRGVQTTAWGGSLHEVADDADSAIVLLRRGYGWRGDLLFFLPAGGERRAAHLVQQDGTFLTALDWDRLPALPAALDATTTFCVDSSAPEAGEWATLDVEATLAVREAPQETERRHAALGRAPPLRVRLSVGQFV